MKITKFGHCCLLIEEGDVRILTDPGNYNETPNISDVDAILITHEHQDHLHLPALREILANNARAEIITHESVGRVLSTENIKFRPIEDTEELAVRGVTITSYGTRHAVIHPDYPCPHNTGFLIGGRLFYPGDNLYNPGVPVDILALPVAAPWLTIMGATEYAKSIHPRVVFPVHDGMLRQDYRLGPTRRVPQTILNPLGIQYIDMREGSVQEF